MTILATNGQNGAMLQASHATQKAHLGGQGGLGLQSWWTKRVAQWPPHVWRHLVGFGKWGG